MRVRASNTMQSKKSVVRNESQRPGFKSWQVPPNLRPSRFLRPSRSRMLARLVQSAPSRLRRSHAIMPFQSAIWFRKIRWLLIQLHGPPGTRRQPNTACSRQALHRIQNRFQPKVVRPYHWSQNQKQRLHNDLRLSIRLTHLENGDQSIPHSRL